MSNLVSVIMPYYRKRKYIKKAVNSVINQSYKKWELTMLFVLLKFSYLNIKFINFLILILKNF